MAAPYKVRRSVGHPMAHQDDHRDVDRHAALEGGESSMCLTCGCLLPHEDHGNPEYLTIEGLERSAVLDGYDLDTALQNLIKTVEVAKKEAEHDHR
jgi:hypothetical protein